MNSFEIVKRKARSIHSECLGISGTDYDGLSLNDAAARSQKYKLYPRPEGDSLLHGARAVLDRRFRIIYFVDNVEPEERAVLIAHELGHLYVHDTDGAYVCSRSDMNGSAPESAAPIGLQRVENYGARERRELQANVFSRELLLPRELARELYLTQGLRASQIARNLKLPIDLVRQQLLDTLLIPAYPNEDTPDIEDIDLSLDSSQEESAHVEHGPLLLEAGPGTGKTRTLVSRIVWLIKNGADPASILALTYSNKVAQELAERVVLFTHQDAANIWTGTFHAFGLELLKQNHQHFGLSPDIRLLDGSDAVEILEELLPTLPLNHYRNLQDPTVHLKDMLGAISRAKDEMVGPKKYKDLAAAMLASAVDEKSQEAAEKAMEVARVYEAYEKTLSEHKLVDFGDLVMKATLLLESNADVRSATRLRHRHVLVDEYQDVNRASARMLMALAADGERLWVVGDARQSIYRFRGASSLNMNEFGNDFKGAIRKALQMNYRSGREITGLLSTFAQSMKASQNATPLKLEPKRGNLGHGPQILVAPDFQTEASLLAAKIRELERNGVGLREQAVLCRTNSRLAELAEELELREIPVLHLGSLFERNEVRDMMSVLSFAVDPQGSSLTRVACFPSYKIPLEDVVTVFRARAQADVEALAFIPHAVNELTLSARGKAGLLALDRDLKGVKKESFPWAVLSDYLLERSDYLAPVITSRRVSDQMKCIALWQFMNFIREQPVAGRGLPIRRVLERALRLVLLGDERDLRQIPASAIHIDAVRMLTIHGSKGLEFEAVHLPTLSVSYFPLSFRGARCPPPDGLIADRKHPRGQDQVRAAHESEEECLFFVAASRARSHLTLYRPEKRNYTNSRRTNPSPFVATISSALLSIANPELLPRKTPVEDSTFVPLRLPGTPAFDASRLRYFDDCPRRSFYTHFMNVSGRLRDAAFLQAHKCVYEVIDWIKAEQSKALPSMPNVLAQLDAVWARLGPVDHAYESEYRQLAQELLRNFRALSTGVTVILAEGIKLQFQDMVVSVTPDQVVRFPNGSFLMRRIRTGKPKSNEEDDSLYALYHLAARAHYGGAPIQIETIHLTTKTVTRITIEEKKLNAGRKATGDALASIRKGHFPPKPDPFICPRCPHFVYCPSVPEGTLDLS